MEHFYNDHHIEVVVWLDGHGWRVSVFVYYQEENRNTLVTFSVNGKFATHDEAETTGLAAAQRWIDREISYGDLREDS